MRFMVDPAVGFFQARLGVAQRLLARSRVAFGKPAITPIFAEPVNVARAEARVFKGLDDGLETVDNHELSPQSTVQSGRSNKNFSTT